MPTTIVSSDTRVVKGAESGRFFDFMQNGYLWVAVQEAATDTIHFYYSVDLGLNWTESVASRLDLSLNGVFPEIAFYIDKDNHAHLVYSTGGSATRYAHGVASADLTSFTWVTTALDIMGGGQSLQTQDVVAHREGTGWVAHVVSCEYNVGATAAEVYWTQITITSGHGVSRVTTSIKNFGALATCRAALDFRHTESDPKEVQSSTPSLYVVYHAPGLPTNLFFKKIAYSAGVWTPGTERTIDAVAQQNSRGTSLVYDGTRVMMTGVRSASNTVIRVYERDEADTTTTARDPTALADGIIQCLSLGLAKSGNVWLVARGATSLDVKKLRFVRGTVTWDAAWTTVEADTSTSGLDVCIGRGMLESLCCVYRLFSSAPDQARFEVIVSAFEASATLQGVATVSPDPSLGISADASLQGVATVSPTGNVGHGPTALLQSVGTLEAKGLLTPLQDYTVYDAYIDGLGIFGPSGLIYYEDEQAKKTTVSQQLRPARQDIGDQPTEVRPEQGEVFSQQDFSHGAGQLYYHHEGRDTKRYLWSEGYDVDIDTVGQPATLVHQHAVSQMFASATAGKVVIFNDLPFVIDGTTIRRGSGDLPGFMTDDGPHGAETPTTPQDMVSSGEFLYAALGANGIHRRNTAGLWTHWSDVQATRVAWLKNRIIAAAGPAIYEIITGGAAPTPIETLPAGWAFESIFEVSGFVYATAVSRTSELSRIHAYKLNQAGTALEKKSETPFPRDQLITAGSGYLDNVLLGGGIKTSLGGFDPVLYQAGVTDQDTGALSYAKIAEGEGAGASDLSVKAFEALGEDVAFSWSLGSGFSFGARDGLALLKLAVGGFFPYLKVSGAGESRSVESVCLWKGSLLFTVKGKGVYFEDVSKVVSDAYLISSVADYQTTARKVWDLSQVSHAPLPADTIVRLDVTTRNPADNDWALAITSDVDAAEIAEARFDDLASRLLAVRISSSANAGQTEAPSGLGFLVRSNLLPDTPEWNLTRYVRLMKRDRKDGGGEDVFLPDVQATLRSIQQLAYRVVSFYEPGVKWTVRIDRVADMTPFLPRYWETEGEERRDVYILQLTMSGTRD